MKLISFKDHLPMQLFKVQLTLTAPDGEVSLLHRSLSSSRYCQESHAQRYEIEHFLSFTSTAQVWSVFFAISVECNLALHVSKASRRVSNKKMKRTNDNIISAFLFQWFLIKEFNLTCLNCSMSHYISFCSCYCLPFLSRRYQLFCYFFPSFILLDLAELWHITQTIHYYALRNPINAAHSGALRAGILPTTNV